MVTFGEPLKHVITLRGQTLASGTGDDLLSLLHHPAVSIQNAPVCTFKSSPCMPALNVHTEAFWMDTRGFQRAAPHTPHHDHNHNHDHKHTQRHPSTNTQQKHSNTQQHHISFFFSFLSVCSVRLCFLFMSLSFILCFSCSPLFPMLCLVFFWGLCLFSCVSMVSQ